MATRYNIPGATKRTALTAWAANTAYSIGDKRKPTNGLFWLECTTAGTSHATTEPTWAAVYGNTKADGAGTLVWTYRGTGDSYTPADRGFHFEDTYSGASNFNNIASGDVVANVAGTYTIGSGVALQTPAAGSSEYIFNIVVDGSTGAFDPTQVVTVDRAGNGDGMTLAAVLNCWVGFNIINTQTSAGWTGSSTTDGNVFYLCGAETCAANGWQIVTNGGGMTVMAYCYANNNTGAGFSLGNNTNFAAGTTFNGVVAYKCKAASNTGVQYALASAIALDCEGFSPAGATYHTFANASFAVAVAIGCTASRLADTNSASDAYGFHTLAALLNCISVGVTNSGAGTGYGINYKANSVNFGNIVYGNDTGTTGSPLVSVAASTADPGFASTTDVEPTNDLLGIAIPEVIGAEANWIVPGAVQKIPSTGAGGAPKILIPQGGIDMQLRKGDTYRATFTTVGATGVAVNADSLPTAAVKKNGVADGAVTVTVANDSTGQYSASFTVPTGYAHGDLVEVVASATIATIATKTPLSGFVVISKMAYDDGVTLGDNTRVLELDGVEWRERRYAPGDTPGTPTIQDSHLLDPYGNELANIPARKLGKRGVNEV